MQCLLQLNQKDNHMGLEGININNASSIENTTYI